MSKTSSLQSYIATLKDCLLKSKVSTAELSAGFGNTSSMHGIVVHNNKTSSNAFYRINTVFI